ncbi:alpha/beta hydrolase [Metabacillus flavus]|nr:alpha/beta hydrolase [Metabacillus flavus]
MAEGICHDFASKDGLTSLKDIENSEIQGGNHAQFGLYEKQKGDNPADIPAEQQQKQVIQYMENWIKRGSGK